MLYRPLKLTNQSQFADFADSASLDVPSWNLALGFAIVFNGSAALATALAQGETKLSVETEVAAGSA